MTKKILFSIILLGGIIGLVACRQNSANSNVNNQASQEVPDSGVVIDITEKNGQIIFANLGDELIIDLKGNTDDKYQWSFREPISGGFLILKKHNIIETDDKRLANNEFISEWRFKLIKSGTFEIRFDYENSFLSSKPKKVFRIKVTTDSASALSNIIIDSPMAGETVKDKIMIRGYAKTISGKINYRVKNSEGKNITEGVITTTASDPAYGYFEKEVKVITVAGQDLTVELYQIAIADGQEIDLTKVELKT